jgi:uncharacterized cupin superfamily protein
MTDRIMNIDKAELKENGDGQSFVARVGHLSAALGSPGLGCSLTVVPPGKRAYPFHRHHNNHEIFYVVAGHGEVRIGDERRTIGPGDLIASPAGAEPHQILNNSDSELRYLGFSTQNPTDILEYPDSGKVAYSAGMKDGDYKSATIQGLGKLQPAGYFDGEEPPKA